MDQHLQKHVLYVSDKDWEWLKAMLEEKPKPSNGRDNKVNSLDLARYIINRCNDANYPTTNLQLQKILWLMQVSYCYACEELLFTEEFKVIPLGPVLPSVWNTFDMYGGSLIYGTDQVELPVSITTNSTIQFINDAIDDLRHRSPYEITRASMSDDSPWALIFQDGKGIWQTIPNQLIFDHVEQRKIKKAETI